MTRLLFLNESEDAIERTLPDCKTPNGVYPVAADYMRQVAHINIVQTWTQVRVPALIVYGRSDFITEEPDHTRIAAVVNAGHPGEATMVALDGMDHYLLRAPSQRASQEAVSAGTARPYDVDFSRTVVRWLCAHATCRTGGGAVD